MTEWRWWRTLIAIDAIYDDKTVIARVPSWDSKKQVSFPLSAVPEEIRPTVVPGGFVIAMATIGAETAKDLQFRDFEIAPDPVLGEELA